MVSGGDSPAQPDQVVILSLVTCHSRESGNPGQPLSRSPWTPAFAGATSKLASGIPSNLRSLDQLAQGLPLYLGQQLLLTYWVTVSMPFRYCSSSGVISASTKRTWRDGSSTSKRAQNQGSPRVRIRSFSGRCHSKAQLSTRGQSWMGKRPPIISPGSGGRRKW